MLHGGESSLTLRGAMLAGIVQRQGTQQQVAGSCQTEPSCPVRYPLGMIDNGVAHPDYRNGMAIVRLSHDEVCIDKPAPLLTKPDRQTRDSVGVNGIVGAC